MICLNIDGYKHSYLTCIIISYINEIHLRYYVLFWANTLGKAWTPKSP